MTAADTGFQSKLPRAGWVLYDDGCGFCYRWVHFWESIIARRGFSIKGLHAARDDGSLTIPRESLLDDILVLTTEGQVVSGADAYLFVAQRIWWTWPFYAVFSMPVLNDILWSGYRWFNRNRYRISSRCPLPRHPMSNGSSHHHGK